MTKMEELLSYIDGPVIMGRPVYNLCSCLERLADKDLRWMLEVYQAGQNNDPQSAEHSGNTSHDSSMDHSDTIAGHDPSMSRPGMIDGLVSYVTNPDVVNLLIKTEELTGSYFIKSTVAAIRRADDLWESAAEVDPSDKEIKRLKKELHDLEIEAHTYYPQPEGQFETDAEYEDDRNRHYAEIDKKIEACKMRLADMGDIKAEKATDGPAMDEPAEVSLVLNSETDAHFSTLQRAGLIYLFTDWDGKGRESGYRFALDENVNWSEVPKRERDDPWSSVYNIGRVVYDRRYLGERLIGAQPFKARRVVRNGVRVWTTEPPRGMKAPAAEDDVYLRLVVPVEVQKIVWDSMLHEQNTENCHGATKQSKP